MEANVVEELTLEDLQQALEEALWAYEPVRTASREVEARVQPGGVVEVSGYVRSRLIKDGVLNILRRHPGVNEVVDHLIADPDLELAVAMKLATDPRTRDIPPGAVAVHSHFGAVTLVGRLPVGFSHAEVVEVVREVPGVRHVVDRLA